MCFSDFKYLNLTTCEVSWIGRYVSYLPSIENAAAEAFSLFLLSFSSPFFFFLGGYPQTPLTLNSLKSDEEEEENALKI